MEMAFRYQRFTQKIATCINALRVGNSLFYFILKYIVNLFVLTKYIKINYYKPGDYRKERLRIHYEVRNTIFYKKNITISTL